MNHQSDIFNHLLNEGQFSALNMVAPQPGMLVFEKPGKETGRFILRENPLKRIFDVVFSLLIIALVVSWLLPLLAILIKITSRGPVFFVQNRTGRHNRVFPCFKLRSMYLNSEADRIQSVKNDPRITPAGRLLRKFSLDELPQFFNVLLGHMSVVGPRPHMLHHTHAYSVLVEEYPKRLLIRPGITGLSQVEGYRGEIRDRQMLKNRIRLDLFYVRHWSFGLDLRIILKTMKLVLVGDEKAR